MLVFLLLLLDFGDDEGDIIFFVSSLPLAPRWELNCFTTADTLTFSL